MKNPTLLKACVFDAEEARELMDYLYCERIHHTGSFKCNDREEVITWFENESNDSCIAKWTMEYGNIMVSKDFLEKGR